MCGAKLWLTLALLAAVQAEPGNKRVPTGFLGMRGKKLDPDPRFVGFDLVDDPSLDSLYDQFEALKRAPKGFQGMRGKKDYSYEDMLLDEVDKRAMGFQGVRGKKEYDEDKRGSLGFLGMRGKKNDELMLLDDSQDALMRRRRASNIGFYGVRGKKVASFYGMRGKKGPDYPLRGKFVGVRGKKYDSGVQLLVPWEQDAFDKRKGPSGFMGVRGKKWVAADSDLANDEQ